jgi:hypothetical protein
LPSAFSCCLFPQSAQAQREVGVDRLAVLVEHLPECCRSRRAGIRPASNDPKKKCRREIFDIICLLMDCG